MIRRIENAARRGVRVRLFVPANANNWACAGAQQFHHPSLLEAGVRILEYPAMLHAKAFVRDGEEVLAGTCNLEAWSLKRFFEIDLQIQSTALAAPVRGAVQRTGRGSVGSRARTHRQARAGARESSGDPLAAALTRGSVHPGAPSADADCQRERQMSPIVRGCRNN